MSFLHFKNPDAFHLKKNCLIKGWIFFISLQKHPFLLALRRWGRFAFPPRRETSPAAKSEEKRMFSQANCKTTFARLIGQNYCFFQFSNKTYRKLNQRLQCLLFGENKRWWQILLQCKVARLKIFELLTRSFTTRTGEVSCGKGLCICAICASGNGVNLRKITWRMINKFYKQRYDLYMHKILILNFNSNPTNSSPGQLTWTIQRVVRRIWSVWLSLIDENLSLKGVMISNIA